MGPMPLMRPMRSTTVVALPGSVSTTRLATSMVPSELRDGAGYARGGERVKGVAALVRDEHSTDATMLRTARRGRVFPRGRSNASKTTPDRGELEDVQDPGRGGGPGPGGSYGGDATRGGRAGRPSLHRPRRGGAGPP